MRVVIATGIYPPDIGGPATHSSDLAKELVARGHRVTILTLWDGAKKRTSGPSVRYPRAWPWWVRTPLMAIWLARHKGSYDLIYATGLHPEATLGGKLSRKPVVLKVVGDPVWERGRRLDLVASGFDAFQRESDQALTVRTMRWLRNWCMRKADVVTAPSEYLAGIAEAWVKGSTKVQVVPNGVRVPPQVEAAGGQDASVLRAISVGRLVAHKRLDVLLEAVAQTPGTFLEIIGEGPERNDLEALATRLGLDDRVRFLGDCPHQKVLANIASSDVLLLASAYEGLPHVAIESLACGTPLVASSAGGIVEVVSDAVNGLIVEPPTAKGFAAALSRLRNEPDLQRQLADKALISGREWGFDACADRLENLFSGLIQQKNPNAVFFGKGGLAGAASGSLAQKLEILSRWLSSTIIASGPSPGSRPPRVSVLAFPRLPAPLDTILFYSTGACLSITLAILKRPSAIVCQSPYEGFGVVLLSRLAPRRFRPQVVIEVHGDWKSATRLYGPLSRRKLAPVADWVAAYALRRADRVRTISAYTEDLVRRTGYEGETDQFMAFADLGKFVETDPCPLPTESTVAFVGAFEPSKGVDVLLKAWPKVVDIFPTAELVLAGAGTLMRDLKAQVSTQRLKSVEFAGNLSSSVVKELLDQSSLLVVPSRSEGLGRVVLEAFARGRAVIASHAGGLPELVEDGRTGITVPPDNPEALAAAIIELLGDPEKLLQMGRQARTEAVKRDPMREFEGGIKRLASWIGQSAKHPRRESFDLVRNLLVFNLATDADDPILGFTTGWIRALAANVEQLDVVTMRAGRIDVPGNVRVFSVGKELNYGEARRALSFYRLLAKLLKETDYDACFAHMMPLFAVMGAPLLKARKVPITLWYVHRSASWILRCAEKLVDSVVTASSESFPVLSSKVAVVGHGVDTTLFVPREPIGPSRTEFRILSVGRIAPIKNIEVMIESIRLLTQELGLRSVCLRLVGPVYEHDRPYLSVLEEQIRAAEIINYVEFAPAVEPAGILQEYWKADVVISLSPNGLFDKVPLEAMSCGVPVVSCNAGLRPLLAAVDPGLIANDRSAAAIAKACHRLQAKSPVERRAIGLRLRKIIVQDHDLYRLAQRLTGNILVKKPKTTKRLAAASLDGSSP